MAIAAASRRTSGARPSPIQIRRSATRRPVAVRTYCCGSVDEKWLYPTPPNETDAEAAAGALVGITTYLGLFRFARLQTGELVFVNGGSEGVGSSVIQQAKAAGAHVIATVGNAQKAAYCQSLRADVVLDYHSPTLDEEIRHYAAPKGGINVWFETLREPTLDRTISMMAPRKRIILMAGRQARPEFPLGAFYTKDLAMLGFAMFNASPDEQRECATAINDLYARNGTMLGIGWHPAVGITLPLSQAAAAHQLQEDNTLHKKSTLSGKIVLIPGS